MSPWCLAANHWDGKVKCERRPGHNGVHKGFNKLGGAVEWAENKPVMWSPPTPKPEPVFTEAELAELYILLYDNPDTNHALLAKIAKLLKEAL